MPFTGSVFPGNYSWHWYKAHSTRSRMKLRKGQDNGLNPIRVQYLDSQGHAYTGLVFPGNH